MTLLLLALLATLLLAWRRRDDTLPPAAPIAAIGATFGPWADHGPRCQCSPCR